MPNFITKNFTLDELLESQTARRLGYSEQFQPDDTVIENLTLLCTKILQPLRDYTRGSIQITSGYRCNRTNKAIGGAVNSQHLKGMAADINSSKMTNAKLFNVIQELGLPFDQLIWEYGTREEPAWVHVSSSANPRKQIIYI